MRNQCLVALSLLYSMCCLLCELEFEVCSTAFRGCGGLPVAVAAALVMQSMLATS